MSSLATDSDDGLDWSAVVLGVHPLLSVVAVAALALSFAMVLLPLPELLQALALLGVAFNVSATLALAALTPLLAAAVLDEVRSHRWRETDWNPPTVYLLTAFGLHVGWLALWSRTVYLTGRTGAEFLGEWYYSVLPLLAGVLLLAYLYDRRTAVGVPYSLPLTPREG